MLKIRLTRRGKRNKAFFRLVVAEHTSPIKGKFIEVLGFFNPHTKEKSLKSERVKYWLEKGAQCSDSAHNLLVSAGIVSGPKRAIKMKKKEVKEPSKEESKPNEPAQEDASNEADGGGKKPVPNNKEEAPAASKKPDLGKKEEGEALKKKEEKTADKTEAADAEQENKKPEKASD